MDNQEKCEQHAQTEENVTFKMQREHEILKNIYAKQKIPEASRKCYSIIKLQK